LDDIANKLTLNASKSNIIIINFKINSPTVEMSISAKLVELYLFKVQNTWENSSMRN